MKHRFLSLIVCAAMLLTTACGAKKSENTKDDEKPITASFAAKDMQLGINLGNTMEAYYATDNEKVTYKWIETVGSNTPKEYETFWGAVETTQEVIDGMKDAGFNTVRIPVFWGNMMENDGTYTINKDYIKRVAEIVDYCMKDDLYAVINIHHFDEFIIRRNSLEDCEKIFDNLWTQIAYYFKDYSYKLVFEGYNEYLGGAQFDENGELKDQVKADGYEMTNALNQTFVDAVRKTGGKNAERVLIASGYWTNIDLTTAADFVMPKDTVDDRLMVSVHYVDNAMFWTNQIGSENWLKYTDSQIDLLKTAFTDKGIPVFLGECTAGYPDERFAANAKYTGSAECMELVMQRLIDNGFVPVLWDVNDNYYSRTEYKIKDDKQAELIKKLAAEYK